MAQRRDVRSIDPDAAASMLAGARIAVVGASDESGNCLEVVPGACPLMFLEPVGWFHRIHRAGRRANGTLAAVS